VELGRTRITESTGRGTTLTKAIQRKIGVRADGIWGHRTERAFQRVAEKENLPAQMSKADLQKWVNGTYKRSSSGGQVNVSYSFQKSPHSFELPKTSGGYGGGTSSYSPVARQSTYNQGNTRTSTGNEDKDKGDKTKLLIIGGVAVTGIILTTAIILTSKGNKSKK